MIAFRKGQRKDDVAAEQRKKFQKAASDDFRRKRGIRDGVVFVGVAQEKALAFQGKKIDGQFLFTRDKRFTQSLLLLH